MNSVLRQEILGQSLCDTPERGSAFRHWGGTGFSERGTCQEKVGFGSNGLKSIFLTPSSLLVSFFLSIEQNTLWSSDTRAIEQAMLSRVQVQVQGGGMEQLCDGKTTKMEMAGARWTRIRGWTGRGLWRGNGWDESEVSIHRIDIVLDRLP